MEISFRGAWSAYVLGMADAGTPVVVPPTAGAGEPAYVNAMSHFYRGELGRAMIWRQRLDATTTWAITTTSTIFTVAFSFRDVPHLVFFFNLTVVSMIARARVQNQRARIARPPAQAQLRFSLRDHPARVGDQDFPPRGQLDRLVEWLLRCAGGGAHPELVCGERHRHHLCRHARASALRHAPDHRRVPRV
ncbi:MAG: DUF2270 domain-containing protein [Verrucomicrobia bacterium]|nr:DUF2270 domain-containing protein [Verrucomicrobiota bacterium]